MRIRYLYWILASPSFAVQSTPIPAHYITMYCIYLLLSTALNLCIYPERLLLCKPPPSSILKPPNVNHTMVEASDIGGRFNFRLPQITLKIHNLFAFIFSLIIHLIIESRGLQRDVAYLG
jgi:hypothetical protein